ncbi:hypothetical protein Agub_g9741 [Astrephomene gubernaculifera]|uniref:Uncharacterized protein n=1 Tax=Astrephomene gubernaculifera TaxID=47775 RepID=A0AAD3DU77_9CHLO|nr:hypothetical protein Agub_g9741 [Astrephomene gubernaculifera]
MSSADDEELVTLTRLLAEDSQQVLEENRLHSFMDQNPLQQSAHGPCVGIEFSDAHGLASPHQHDTVTGSGCLEPCLGQEVTSFLNDSSAMNFKAVASAHAAATYPNTEATLPQHCLLELADLHRKLSDAYVHAAAALPGSGLPSPGLVQPHATGSFGPWPGLTGQAALQILPAPPILSPAPLAAHQLEQTLEAPQHALQVSIGSQFQPLQPPLVAAGAAAASSLAEEVGLMADNDQSVATLQAIGTRLLFAERNLWAEQLHAVWYESPDPDRQHAFFSGHQLKSRFDSGGSASCRRPVTLDADPSRYVHCVQGSRCTCEVTRCARCKEERHPYHRVFKYLLAYRDGPVPDAEERTIKDVSLWVPRAPRVVLWHVKPRTYMPDTHAPMPAVAEGAMGVGAAVVGAGDAAFGAGVPTPPDGEGGGRRQQQHGGDYDAPAAPKRLRTVQ